MKRKISVVLTAWLACGGVAMADNPAVLGADALAQESETNKSDDQREDSEASPANDTQEAEKIAPAEENDAAESQLERIRKSVKERKKREAELRSLDIMRESRSMVTEYTVDPGSVEMVVELDPNNYGFRQRNHRMTLGGEFDLLLRGRGMLAYDFRFFEYWSFAVKAGVDWNDISLYSRFRDQLNKPAPKQFSVLGGLSAKLRLTEWYMRSAIFLEPSILTGYMWQTLINQESSYWRVRPGLFAVLETVFDSGLAMNFRLGFELPFDFGEVNPINEAVEPLTLFGLGLAI